MMIDYEALLESMDGIALVIDRELKIQCVGKRNWRAFWRENSGGYPDTPIIGRAIADAIEYLLYQSVALDSRPRPPLALFDVAASGLERPDLLRICCVCAKVAWKSSEADAAPQWIDAEDYYARGGKEVSMLSHGFCEPCASKLLADDRAAAQIN